MENNENVLSDLQRDEIDRTFETFQRDLPSMIMHIRLQCASSQKLPDQMREHCLNVTQLMESYAKRVCNSHNQMKKLRTQRAIDRQKVFRLASDLPESLNQLRNRIRPRTDSQSEAENVPLSPTMNQPVVTKQTYHYEDQGLLNSESETLLDSLTEEEMQAFQQENEQLYDEMNALNEEVK